MGGRTSKAKEVILRLFIHEDKDGVWQEGTMHIGAKCSKACQELTVIIPKKDASKWKVTQESTN